MSVQKKLRACRGETLTETLVAVLLVGLASVVLASMIGVASRLSTQTAEQDAALYAEVTAAETRADGASGSMTVTVHGRSETFPVTYYGAEGELHSYMYRKGGGGS